MLNTIREKKTSKMRYHKKPLRMTNTSRTGILSVVKDVEQLGLSYAAVINVKWYNHSGKKLSFLQS